MKGFKRKIYKMGPRGNVFPIPQEIAEKMNLVIGEYLYCYLSNSEKLIYSREKRRSVPVGRYKVTTASGRTLPRIAVQKAWMDYHGLKHGDHIEVKCKGKEIIISNGGINGKE